MNLTFQVPVPYCSSHHQTLFSPADACTTECHFHFGPVTSFLLELLVIALCLPTIEYWTPSDQRPHLPLSYLFAFHIVHGGLQARIWSVLLFSTLVDHILSELFTMIPLGQPCTAWLITWLRYTSHFAKTMLLVMKGKEILLHDYWNGKKLEEKKQKTKKKTQKSKNW